MLHFLDASQAGGADARAFVLDDGITGMLWDGESFGTQPLVLVAHGGGQSAQAPGVRAKAEYLCQGGYTVAALDAPGHGGRPRTPDLERLIGRMRDAQGSPDFGAVVAAMNAELARQAVSEWSRFLDALESEGLMPGTPVGFWGFSLGAAIGFPFAAAEERIRAAVLGLVGDHLAESARALRVPVEFVMQWDDPLVPRDSALRLFDAIGSAEKSLHANPGSHGQVPDFENASSLAFFDRHLASAPA